MNLLKKNTVAEVKSVILNTVKDLVCSSEEGILRFAQNDKIEAGQ